MNKKVKKWRSPSLGCDMKLAVYGNGGTPILAFPTRGESCEQWESKGMTDAISLQLKEEFNQLFCVDSVDEESFLNKNIDAAKRIRRHIQFESFILDEVIPFIREINNIEYLIVAGVDMGAYHALNIALKYPRHFGKSIAISGIYDMKHFLDDFYDENVYYNNPVDYIPNLNKQDLLNQIREVDYRLVSFTNDLRKEEAEQMSNILQMKFIEHELDIWDIDESEEWELWKQMLKTHII
jgi:esterase/lipase superfamily enzyme